MIEFINEEIATEVIKEAASHGADFAEVFCQYRTVTQIRFEEGKVQDISSGIDCGAGVRAVKGDLAAFAHTDILERAQLLKAASAVSEALKYATGSVAISPQSSSVTPPVVKETGTGNHDPRKVVEILRQCDEEARSQGKEIKQVTVVHAEATEHFLIANSLGEITRDAVERTRFVIQVIASRDGENQTGQETAGSLLGRAFYDSVDVVRLAREAATRALTMLDAKPSPAGRMPVVVNAGTGGVLIHEACGHGMELDQVLKGASVYAGKEGQKVASSLVTVADDPTIFGLWGSYSLDDEGTPSSETILIENGRLVGFLSGRHEAMRSGRISSGNGRRQSYKHVPIPRMSNTFIKAGTATHDEIISSTRKGIFARKLGGGQVDPVTGDYVFSVMEGYTIEKGELGYPVRGAVLIGNGPRTLEMMEAVGNNLSWEIGTCGKDGQSVPVGTGCPTLRIAELTVGGTET